METAGYIKARLFVGDSAASLSKELGMPPDEVIALAGKYPSLIPNPFSALRRRRAKDPKAG